PRWKCCRSNSPIVAAHRRYAARHSALNQTIAHDDRVVHALHGDTMGTRWRVCMVGGARLPLRPLHDAVQATLDRVVSQMSTWEVDSDISRYNRAEAGSW